MACHMVKAHGTVAAPIAAPRGGGTDVPPPTAAEPPVPHLLPLAAGGGPDGEEPAAAAAPVLPGLASVAALALEGVDLSQGMTAAFPGYGELRLLAPTAELRLLHAGVSPMVNATNLRWGLGRGRERCWAADAGTPVVARRHGRSEGLAALPRPPCHAPPALDPSTGIWERRCGRCSHWRRVAPTWRPSRPATTRRRNCRAARALSAATCAHQAALRCRSRWVVPPTCFRTRCGEARCMRGCVVHGGSMPCGASPRAVLCAAAHLAAPSPRPPVRRSWCSTRFDRR